MSACSSQLSASLLGSKDVADADSAAAVNSTLHKHRRSVSAGRNAVSRQASHGSKGSKQTVHKHPCSAGPPQSPARSSVSTPESMPRLAPKAYEAYPAESVASQGRTRAKTPESTASTGKSQAVKGLSLSNQLSRQQATASSRHSQQHPKATIASQVSKSSFLDRLQDNASSKPSAAASKKQAAQQHDAKAAEMKAKLLEWRQQQQQQKLQKQQPVTKQSAVPTAAAAKKRQQSQHMTGRAETAVHAPSVAAARQLDRRADATSAAANQENNPVQHSTKSKKYVTADTAKASTPTSSAVSRQPFKAIQDGSAVQPGASCSDTACLLATDTMTDRATAQSQSCDASLAQSAEPQPGTEEFNRPTSECQSSGNQIPGLASELKHHAHKAAHALPDHAHIDNDSSTGPHAVSAIPPLAPGSGAAAEAEALNPPLCTSMSNQGITELQDPDPCLPHTVAKASDGIASAALSSTASDTVDHAAAADTASVATAQLHDSASVDPNSVAALDLHTNLHASTSEAEHSAGSAATSAAKGPAVTASAESNANVQAAKVPKPRGTQKGSRESKGKGPTVQERTTRLQCLRWQHLQWLFLNCKLEEAMQHTKPKAEQALTNVAHHIVTMQREVAQQKAELRSAERQQQIETALASQMPSLLQWQSMQAEQQHMTSAVQSAMEGALQRVPLINGATAGASSQEADVPAVAESVARLQDSLSQCQGSVTALIGKASATTESQDTDAMMASHQAHQGVAYTHGDLQGTAKMTNALADISAELKYYLAANSQLLEKYSHEVLCVQSLAAQLVQMQSMQL